MNKNSETQYFTELQSLSTNAGQQVSNFPEITKIHVTGDKTSGQLTLQPGFSASITLEGYNFTNAKKIYLSATNQYSISGGHNIKTSLTGVDLFSTYSSLSTTFQSFSGFEVTTFKIVDNNHITLEIPSLTGGLDLNIIIVNPIGHSIPFLNIATDVFTENDVRISIASTATSCPQCDAGAWSFDANNFLSFDDCIAFYGC